VLRKALEIGLHPSWCEKIDRPNARIEEVIHETSDLFLDLATKDHQLDFPTLFANARDGYAGLTPDITSGTMQPLLDAIIKYVPGPEANEDAPFRMLATTLMYDSYRGRIAVGRISDGVVRAGEVVIRFNHEGQSSQHRVAQLFGFEGLGRVELQEARAGDIVALTGISDILIGETIASPAVTEPLPVINRRAGDEMTFRVNDRRSRAARASS